MLLDVMIFCGMLVIILSFFVLCAIYSLLQQQLKVNETQVMAQLCSMLDSERFKEIIKD